MSKGFDAFNEGIAPGGARTKNEIRTLLCYIFYSVGRPVSINTVVNALQSQELVNYFEATACINDLINFKNIEPINSDNTLYKLTQNGEMIVNQLEDTLPTTMKEKAYRGTMDILEAERKERENPIIITETKDGYNVSCNISGDNDMNLLSVSVYAANMSQVEMIKNNFHKNPISFYKTVLAMLSNNAELATDALESIKNNK